MAQTSNDESNVIDMIEDWREETLDLESLLHSTSNQVKTENSSLLSQASSGHSAILTQSAQRPTMIGTNTAVPSSEGLPAYSQKVEIPTFSSANRPSVLDLSTTMKFQERQRPMNQLNGQQQQRAVSPHHSPSPHSPHHSPHHSPYMQNNPAQQVFNYNNIPEQHSPMSPHSTGRVLHSPISPHNHNVDQSPHSPHMPSSGPMSPHQVSQSQPQPGSMSPHSPYSMPSRNSVSPVNPHQGMVSPLGGAPLSPHHISNHSGGGGMSPHHPGVLVQGGMSPHHMSNHSGSVSPIPRLQQMSPTPGASSVFGRYAGGSPVSMHSGNSSDTESYYSACQLADMRKRGLIDKNSDLYKAKRERNNVAVRKSREKKKMREQETEKRVKELSDENSALQSKLDIALKEMNLLKNLYKNIGVQLPQEARHKLETELSKFK